MAFRPSSSPGQVKQQQEDTNGNITRLTVQQYFTNLVMAMACTENDEHDVDVVVHAVNNMDPLIRR